MVDGAQRDFCGRQLTAICPGNEEFRVNSIVPGRQAMLGRTTVALTFSNTSFVFGLAEVVTTLSAWCYFCVSASDAEL